MKVTDNHKCPTCGKKAHNFESEEILNCVPPKEILRFGDYILNENYRKAIYQKFPFYTVEEVIGTYLGYNPNFESQDSWILNKNRH